jgi:hypothetical protein
MKVKEIIEPNELYGTFIQYLNISTESKNLQYLANEIFKAAQKDIQHDKINKSSNSTQELDSVLNKYLNNIGTKEEAAAEAKKNLKNNLTANYSQLKDTLGKVRVFGVGKTTTEKMQTTIGHIGKAMMPVITVCCIAGAAALTYFSFEEGMKAWGSLFKGDAMGYFMNNMVSNMAADGAKGFAVMGAVAGYVGMNRSVELSSIKSVMKKDLKASSFSAVTEADKISPPPSLKNIKLYKGQKTSSSIAG